MLTKFFNKMFQSAPEPVPALPVPKVEMLDIFIYGHSASGKSTFIQRTFTLGTDKLNSTDDFDYYEFNRPKNMGSADQIKFRIADYRGQNPAQLLEQIKRNQAIDCLLFMVDIAPPYSDSMKAYYSTDELLAVMAQDVEKCIYERVQDHKAYMSRFLLQIIFQYALNPNLKSVYFLINKMDLLEKLQQWGKIDRTLDLEVYAKSFYNSIIKEVKTFCDNNNIDDFQIHCISNHQSRNIHQIITNIVSTHNSK